MEPSRLRNVGGEAVMPNASTRFQIFRRRKIKVRPAFLLGVVMIVAMPVYAQNNDNMSDMSQHKASYSMHPKPVAHRRTGHKATYRRTYKTDQEEHQRTEDLNRQNLSRQQ
jgi:hypothetical protein